MNRNVMTQGCDDQLYYDSGVVMTECIIFQGQKWVCDDPGL